MKARRNLILWILVIAFGFSAMIQAEEVVKAARKPASLAPTQKASKMDNLPMPGNQAAGQFKSPLLGLVPNSWSLGEPGEFNLVPPAALERNGLATQEKYKPF